VSQPVAPGERGLVRTAGGLVHWRASQPAARGPVVLLHQISSSSRMFLPLMPELAARGWSSLALDLPGFGFSDPAPPGHQVPDLAATVVEALDGIGVPGPWPLLGHHTGARLGAVIAADHPGRVWRLVLVGLPLYRSERARASRWAAKEIRPVVPEPGGEHLLHEWRRLRELSSGTDPRVIHRELVDTLLADAYDRSYAVVRRHQLAAVVARIGCPTLVLAAAADVQAANQPHAATAIPGARLLELDGGVFVMDERPGAVAGAVAGFLDEGLGEELVADPWTG
jgi:pimeloyl-ACP methyl ester carboxylesterase